MTKAVNIYVVFLFLRNLQQFQAIFFHIVIMYRGLHYYILIHTSHKGNTIKCGTNEALWILNKRSIVKKEDSMFFLPH